MNLLWIATAASITGVILNIYKKKECFIIWAATNLTWCLRNLYIKEYPQASLFAIYFLLAIWGLVKWVKER
jgi:nicotinamide riboside transporter PnuC